ncbi:MAG: multifunctional CCA addition/repair protein [Polaromonas sp.]|nr:multifunctional CCA addition/repair protein [Polaromonas sp.]
MEIYLVGGAVRDALLGLPVQDRDWVVVGSTPEEMTALGYLPVGKDFPVFLHPDTREEYALARTERKTARGYRGFAIHADPSVTLAQDLMRRDLTINSIALPASHTSADGTKSFTTADREALIDPCGGQIDLQTRVLRHVTDAFREDPVRILRLARFAARFHDFSVDPGTAVLMQQMVADGEVDTLVPERVWQELARGLMAKQPSRMLTVLRDCGALRQLLPEVDRLWGVPHRTDDHPEIDTGVHLLRVLDMAAQLNAPLTVRFACLCQNLGRAVTPADAPLRLAANEVASARLLQGVCERWRVPADSRELADLVAREHSNIHRSAALNAEAVVRLLERCDAFRKPARFAEALLAGECDARSRGSLPGSQDAPYPHHPQRPQLMAALTAAQGVATQPIAEAAQAAGHQGPKIGELIHAARVQAVAAAAA